MEGLSYKVEFANPQIHPVSSIIKKEPLSVEKLIEQPTDLRSSHYRNTSKDTPSEQSILDLSCKKTDVLTTLGENDVPYHPIQTFELSTIHENDIKSRKRKCNSGTSEGRFLMFTPPSDSESLSKTSHFEENSLNILTMNNNIEKYPSLPINVPVPSIPPVILSTLLTSKEEEKNNINDNIQLPTTTTKLLPQESPKKVPRPFKAYPLLFPGDQSNIIYAQNSDDNYREFRERMLEKFKRQNESSNPKMRRTTKTSSSGSPTSTSEEKNAIYREKRKKNNEAAKRSRDARRAKEDEIAIRVAFLEQENVQLKFEIMRFKNECDRLRSLLY